MRPTGGRRQCIIMIIIYSNVLAHTSSSDVSLPLRSNCSLIAKKDTKDYSLGALWCKGPLKLEDCKMPNRLLCAFNT